MPSDLPSPEQLVPPPHDSSVTEERFSLSDEPVVELASSNPSYLPAAERLNTFLQSRGFRPRSKFSETPDTDPSPPHIRLRIDPSDHTSPQSYRLHVDAQGIELSGSDEAGLFYAVCTLSQWIALHTAPDSQESPPLTGLQVVDKPDFPVRGVMLDVSRDKVPTMATLYGLVDRLAGWKINQLQLYTEHTFAYRGHEAVWGEADPLTATEIRELDRYCTERLVELVPNQNSFGHFHRWLRHDAYRDLAECPQGIEHPFSDQEEPFSLCAVDPRCLELLEDLYDQLLPQFSSRLFNVGLDETFDLGLGRSAQQCKEKGKGRVYLDFLVEVYRCLVARGYRMQFWGDIILEQPELISELPRDVIPLAWGYEADYPFAENAERFAASGLDFYVCPGTSSWNSLAGRARNALVNLGHAALAGHDHSAAGYLITDWGDFGHLQPLPVSYLGFLAGASFAWNTTVASEPLAYPVDDLLDLHAFDDQATGLGSVALDLGNVYLETGPETRNGSTLFFLLLAAAQPLGGSRFVQLSMEALERSRAQIESTTTRLDNLEVRSDNAELITRELRWVASMLDLACQLGLARLEHGRDRPSSTLPGRTRRRLRKKLGTLIDEHRAIWLARNRPGGLTDSAARLKRIAQLLKS